MKNSFRDPVTDVLKAWGYMTDNAPGDLVQAESDDFDLTPGLWKLVLGVWTPFVPSAVPLQVTPRQARLALFNNALLASVQPAINGLLSPDKDNADIGWGFATYIERANPLVDIVGTAMGLTTLQIDNLFIEAATY